ncbi:DUF2288 domain-containing protein [Thiohalobacter sp.]|uniref:DUF2288 domain-containing protein n=1 Tax=Thiohalobacter sp. TaxID=2025948 RepID=UPI002603D051|nr:DUF2288 domain-containing protein [Thiohalobacter sp.]
MTEGDDLIAELLAQTARVTWPELERHFARGLVIRVAPELDLIAVGRDFAAGDRAAVEAALATGALARLGPAEARHWAADAPELWALVVAPWVLVQERPPVD